MPKAEPTPTTLRLLSCIEDYVHEEDGTIGHNDWPGLVCVLEKELVLLQRLALEPTPSLTQFTARAEKLRTRYDHLASRIDSAKKQTAEELTMISETSRRAKAVYNTYLKT